MTRLCRQKNTLSLHDALPISGRTGTEGAGSNGLAQSCHLHAQAVGCTGALCARRRVADRRSEEHTSELQSRGQLVCRLLLEKKKYEAEHNDNERKVMDEQIRV